MPWREIMTMCWCDKCDCQVDVRNPYRHGICLNCEGGIHINTSSTIPPAKIKRVKVF